MDHPLLHSDLPATPSLLLRQQQVALHPPIQICSMGPPPVVTAAAPHLHLLPHAQQQLHALPYRAHPQQLQGHLLPQAMQQLMQQQQQQQQQRQHGQQALQQAMPQLMQQQQQQQQRQHEQEALQQAMPQLMQQQQQQQQQPHTSFLSLLSSPLHLTQPLQGHFAHPHATAAPPVSQQHLQPHALMLHGLQSTLPPAPPPPHVLAPPVPTPLPSCQTSDRAARGQHPGAGSREPDQPATVSLLDDLGLPVAAIRRRRLPRKPRTTALKLPTSPLTHYASSISALHPNKLTPAAQPSKNTTKSTTSFPAPPARAGGASLRADHGLLRASAAACSQQHLHPSSHTSTLLHLDRLAGAQTAPDLHPQQLQGQHHHHHHHKRNNNSTKGSWISSTSDLQPGATPTDLLRHPSGPPAVTAHPTSTPAAVMAAAPLQQAQREHPSGMLLPQQQLCTTNSALPFCQPPNTIASTVPPFGPSQPKHLYLPHHITKVLGTEVEALWGPDPPNPITTTLCIEVDGVLQPEEFPDVQFGKSGGGSSSSWYVTGVPPAACMGKWHLGWRRQAVSKSGHQGEGVSKPQIPSPPQVETKAADTAPDSKASKEGEEVQGRASKDQVGTGTDGQIGAVDGGSACVGGDDSRGDADGGGSREEVEKEGSSGKEHEQQQQQQQQEQCAGKQADSGADPSRVQSKENSQNRDCTDDSTRTGEREVLVRVLVSTPPSPPAHAPPTHALPASTPHHLMEASSTTHSRISALGQPQGLSLNRAPSFPQPQHSQLGSPSFQDTPGLQHAQKPGSRSPGLPTTKPRSRAGPGKGTAITLDERDVGTLSYPLLRLLDSYKAVSFVRTQELKLLFGSNAKKCLPVTKDVLVELDGRLLPEVYSNVVFKETGASNSVYMKGFPAALALQKLHCGFRKEGDAVVLVLMTPPPGHPCVIAAAEAAAAAGPKPPRKRSGSTRTGSTSRRSNSSRLAIGSASAGAPSTRTRATSGSKRSRRRPPLETEGSRASARANKRARTTRGGYALMARLEEEEEAEEDSWEQPDDEEEDQAWEVGSEGLGVEELPYDDLGLEPGDSREREPSPGGSWEAEDGGMVGEEGWEGGGGAMSEDADGEGSLDGEGGAGMDQGGEGEERWGGQVQGKLQEWLDQSQEPQEQQAGEGLQQREQHLSKKPRLPGTSPLTSRGGSLQPPPLAGSKDAAAVGGADGESGGEGSEQLKSDQPRLEPRSRRPRRGQRAAAAAAATAADKGAGGEAAAEGTGPDPELSQRLHALADIAELLGEEAEGAPAPKPPPSSTARKMHSPSRTPRQARPSPSAFPACHSPTTAARGASRLAGAPSASQLLPMDLLPSHSGQELRGQSPGEEEEQGGGSMGGAKTAGLSRAPSSGPEGQQLHTAATLGHACEAAGMGGGMHGSLVGYPCPSHHTAVAAAAAAAGPCNKLVKAEEGSKRDAEKEGVGCMELLPHLLQVLHVLGASGESISLAEQVLGRRSPGQLKVLQGAALQAVWCVLGLGVAPSLPHETTAPEEWRQQHQRPAGTPKEEGHDGSGKEGVSHPQTSDSAAGAGAGAAAHGEEGSVGEHEAGTRSPSHSASRASGGYGGGSGVPTSSGAHAAGVVEQETAVRNAEHTAAAAAATAAAAGRAEHAAAAGRAEHAAARSAEHTVAGVGEQQAANPLPDTNTETSPNSVETGCDAQPATGAAAPASLTMHHLPA